MSKNKMIFPFRMTSATHDEECAALQWLLAAAAEGIEKEGDSRLVGKYMEEVRPMAVLENRSDTASMRMPRSSNVVQAKILLDIDNYLSWYIYYKPCTVLETK
ncbi:hypothetical protein WISP_65918 [Willisornis vidua]|uniref:Uncharacterized protein n=1 Tax=Willisornis vidua TaxID=1566151 RepID=A0ABQ9DDN8_9PASS|nr:hypothetical protein WISP_65918 [Willisornis vidua]